MCLCFDAKKYEYKELNKQFVCLKPPACDGENVYNKDPSRQTMAQAQPAHIYLRGKPIAEREKAKEQMSIKYNLNSRCLTANWH